MDKGELEVKPVVSISCLTYNHEKFIHETFAGFLMQKTNFPFEIVVHDDASSDKTWSILMEYARKYSNIKVICQQENQFSKTGIYPCAFIYPHLSGKYVAECDGDDYWTDPFKLQKQVDFLDNNLQYIMCHHNFRIQNNGTLTDVKGESKDYTQEELIGYTLDTRDIVHCTKMWRNIYNENTKNDFERFVGDYSLNVMMGMHGMCKYLHGIGPSVYRRMHGTNSWCGLSPEDIKIKTDALYEKIYELIKEKNNPAWTAIRKRFLAPDLPVINPECLAPTNNVAKKFVAEKRTLRSQRTGVRIMPPNWR